MATSDGEETTSSTSSEEDKSAEFLCSPCHSDGKRLEAVGYCKTCEERLCAKCFKYHRLPSPMRKHVLLDREQMIKDISAHGRRTCPKHEDRLIEYNCKIHSFLGCHVCFYQHQKTCKDVRHIQEVAETFASSEELKDFMSKLDCIAQKSRHLLEEAKRNTESVENCHSQAISDFKDFKGQILEAIVEYEKKLIKKTECFKKEQLAKINKNVTKCTAIQNTYQSIATDIEFLQNHNHHSGLFIAVSKSREKVLSLENDLNAVEDDKDVKYLKFEGNAELAELMKSPWALGKLLTKDVITGVDFVADINVKSSNDGSYCYIVCSVLMPNNKLVLADNINKKVKLVNTISRKMVSEMKLSNEPRGVAKVTVNTVAVTVPGDKKIVFVRTGPSLGVDRELGLNGDCQGVDYFDGKLVVTLFNPYRVDMIDLQGTVFRTIDTDSIGRQVFNYPYYVTVNARHGVMYVSNSSGHDVVCLRLDGTTVATYKDSELQYPRQAVVDHTDMVYICAESSKNVHQMTPDCKKAKVLLTQADGLNFPQSISYDETEGKLYIGEYNSNNVKVYRVTYLIL